MVSKFTILFTATILFLFGIVLQPVAAIEAADLLDKLVATVHKDTTPIPPSNVSPACSGQCSDSVLGVFTNCTSNACACSDENSADITSCTTCLVSSNTITQDVGNAIQRDYVRICGNMNILVKSSVSGASPSFGTITPMRIAATVSAAALLSLLA